MKVSDVSQDEIRVRMIIRGLHGKLGQVVEIDYSDDCNAWFKWEDEEGSFCTWYGTDCKVDFVEYRDVSTITLSRIAGSSQVVLASKVWIESGSF